MTGEKDTSAANAAQNPRTVSRGFKPEIGFIGIDSLYLVMEYPHVDIFERWSAPITDFQDPRLFDGIEYDDMVLRRGGLGYKLSIWDGDARLFVTDWVNDKLEGAKAGHGMGVMLQLGPMWLRQFGEVFEEKRLLTNIFGQLMLYGIRDPEQYPIRLNRMDLTIDLLGVDVESLPFHEWEKQWVGYAKQRHLFFKSKSGAKEGFVVGTSQGSVRFKVYDKVDESRKRGKSRFWRSVWGLPAPEDTNEETTDIPVARFEWTVKCYHARFAKLRYVTDFTFERFLGLLNYVTLKWGRLCVPQPDEDHKTNWPLAPLWAELRSQIDEWSGNYAEAAEREYVFEPDIKDEYLRFVTGTLAGLLTRYGFEEGKDGPISLARALSLLHQEGYTMADIDEKAREKWKVFAKLARRSESHE